MSLTEKLKTAIISVLLIESGVYSKMAADTCKYKVYIDFLKIVAIYLVLLNHTWSFGFVHFTVAHGEFLYPLYLAAAIIIKIAVPLFFMSSGALLLGKEESYKALLLNRFFKYLIVLVIGSGIAYLYGGLQSDSNPMSLGIFLKNLYTTDVATQFWYLYAYLAYILMLPLLRKLAKSMTAKEYHWMFLMYALMQGIRIFDFILWKDMAFHNGNFSFFIVGDYVFYPLMGYYIDRVIEKEQFSARKRNLLGLVALLGIFICGYLTHWRCTINDRWDEAFCQELFGTVVFLLAIAVFYATKMWFETHRVSDRTASIIKIASGTTFGIYLIEQICRMETFRVFDKLEPYIGTFPACMVWILVACLSGGIVIYFVKKIPGVKKFI